MKRLTVKGFKWSSASIFRDIDRWSIAECLNRLFAYEDSGLTPPEIMKLKERNTAKKPVRAEDVSAACMKRWVILSFVRGVDNR